MKTIAEIKAIRDAAPSQDEFLDTLRRLQYTSEDVSDQRLGSLAYNLQERRTELARRARSLQGTATNVLTKLEYKDISYSGVNGSGELQGEGPRFDVACARYEDAFRAFTEELGNRHAAERSAAREAKLAACAGSWKGNIIDALRSGDKTVKQIARETGLKEVEAIEGVSKLIAEGMVQSLGRHCRFVASFQVAVDGEEVRS